MRPRAMLLFGLLLPLVLAGLAGAAPVSALSPPEGPLGRHLDILQEGNTPLDLAAARAALARGDFRRAEAQVPSFGIGARPVWAHFSVHNGGATPVLRRLSVDTAWLDRIDVYLGHEGTVDTWRLGDAQPPEARAVASRPISSRHWVVEHAFAPGITEVFVRVATPDPLVLPVRLETPQAQAARENREALSYGLVYGFLIALMAYNAILYVSLRSPAYLLYALYLAAFVAMNLSYTGHATGTLWDTGTVWQQWSNPVLMVLYGLFGLAFAIAFLDLRRHFPRGHRALLAFCGVTLGLLAWAGVGNQQASGLLVAFTFAFLFAPLMLVLGFVSLGTGQKPARYFLYAAAVGMAGALVTTVSVWGFLPYNEWRFRAVELGMLGDATLLALALGHQVRLGRERREEAERLAQIDPLTGLNNRRAFYERTRASWSGALRHGHPMAVILADLDHFKAINDRCGHAHGDQVLRAMAKLLRLEVRDGDVVARWGGEEFIVCLPETTLDEAAALAERLRRATERLAVPHGSGSTRLSASFGVAARLREHASLDALIAAADGCLYRAKAEGRNRVAAAGVGGALAL